MADFDTTVGAGLPGAAKSTTHATNRVDPEIGTILHHFHPNRTPFLAAMRAVPDREKITQPTFITQTTQEVLQNSSFTDAKTDSETDVTIDDAIFIPGDIILNQRTREQMRITTTSSGSALLMQRGYHSTAVAVEVGDGAILLGNIRAEGQDKIQLRSRRTGSHTAYVGNIDVTTGITDTAEFQAVRGMGELERLIGQNMSNFNNMAESMLLYSQTGITSSDDVTSTPATTAEGIKEYALQGTVTDAGGTFDYSTIINALATPSTFGGSIKRTAFVAGTLLRKIALLPEVINAKRTTDTTGVGPNTLGFNIEHIVAPGVDLTLIESQMVEQHGFTDELVFCNLASLKIVEFLPQRFVFDIQTPGAARKEWAIRWSFGLKVPVIGECGIIQNMDEVATAA